MFDVGRSTCPQCLDGGVSRIQPFDLYIDVSTNQMHYAWQAGVRQQPLIEELGIKEFRYYLYSAD